MEDPQKYFRLPPRGITKGTARIGPDILETYTYLCDTNDNCYAVAYGKTEESVRSQLKGHVCPAPARRDAHPSGRSVVEKAWDELDDAIDRIKSQAITCDELEREKAYARGIAEVLAYLAIPYFRMRDDILRQANKRWKMRTGEIPWEPTPGYRTFPAEPLQYIKDQKPAKPVLGKRTTKTTKAATPAAKPVRTFTVEESKLIRDSIHINGMPAEDLAKMFGTTAERIKAVAGPKPNSDTPQIFGALLQN
jgi:hypothetical protein